MHQWDGKVWPYRLQQATGNAIVALPNSNSRQSKTVERVKPVSIHRVKGNFKAHGRYYDEFIVVDKEKEAQTGRWVLNTIATREANQQSKIVKKKVKYDFLIDE